MRKTCGAIAAMLWLWPYPAASDPLADAHRAEAGREWRAEPAGAPLTVARRDCVGFALRYRAHLRAAGIADADMTVMNVPAPGGRHAVLLVRFGGVLWTLDQTQDGPVPWRRPEGRFNPIYAGAPIPAWAPAWWK